MRLPQLSIYTVALVLGIAPALVINLNYLIAAAEGFVPWCVPYWDSCTSISATGRQGSAFFFFKATMLPLAFVYLLYWRRVNQALNAAGYRSRTISTLGLISTVALGCYTIALGAVGDNFQLTRRIGIIFYFTFTYLNQLLTVYQIYKRRLPDPTRSMQLALCGVVLAIGLLTLGLDLALSNYDDYEDAFEWILALLIHLNFLFAAVGWRRMIAAPSRGQDEPAT